MARSYASRIIYLRRVAEMSSRELSRLAGISESHASQLETRVSPTVTAITLHRIAKVFGVNLGWLFSAEGPASADRTIRHAARTARARYAQRSVADT